MEKEKTKEATQAEAPTVGDWVGTAADPKEWQRQITGWRW
jgi:hypothetical protein